MAGVLFKGMKGFVGALSVGLAVGLASAAGAQEAPKLLSEHSDWTAYTHATSKGTVCFMASQPKQARGNYTRRGEIYVMVTHRPGEGVRDEVSFVAGYDFPNGGRPTVSVGSQRYSLVAQGEHAWAEDSNTDKRLVESMRAGSTMVVQGKSARGTDTTDTYSLNGFTAAYNAISAACR